jgi:hypothetical protein
VIAVPANCEETGVQLGSDLVAQLGIIFVGTPRWTRTVKSPLRHATAANPKKPPPRNPGASA